MKKIFTLLAAALMINSISLFAQKAKLDTSAHTTLYTCAMHPDVKMDQAGKCPNCGMELQLSKKEQLKKEVSKNYHCPVHADVVSDKSGKCSKCNKNLLRSKKEEMKAEIVKSFVCSMHPDIVSDKPGKCSKCGMDLTERKMRKE